MFFFLDVDGHADESSLTPVLEEVRKNCSLFRVLGAYPKAIN